MGFLPFSGWRSVAFFLVMGRFLVSTLPLTCPYFAVGKALTKFRIAYLLYKRCSLCMDMLFLPIIMQRENVSLFCFRLFRNFMGKYIL